MSGRIRSVIVKFGERGGCSGVCQGVCVPGDMVDTPDPEADTPRLRGRQPLDPEADTSQPRGRHPTDPEADPLDPEANTPVETA